MSEALLTEEFDAQATALEDFDVSSAKLMQADKHWEFFARLRDEAPVHYCKDSMFGPYWSITRFADIMEIEKNWQDFSSDLGITLTDRPEDFSTP
ncbi:MAG: cytochrome P450, partial [Pseudomonadales bacterium]|nr:cytochrome P450 [Pseudomonadales bacterium]